MSKRRQRRSRASIERAHDRDRARKERGDAEQLSLLEKRGFGECREAKRLREKLFGGKPEAPSMALEKE